MSSVDDLENTELVRIEGDVYLLRKKGTKIYGIVNQKQMENMALGYAGEMLRIVDETFGKMTNELVGLARKSPHALLKAAKTKGWEVEEEEGSAAQYLSAEIGKDEMAVVTFVPPLTNPEFLEYLDRGESYVGIRFQKDEIELHPKDTPEEKIRQTNEKVKELVEAARNNI
jgi:hypothetical protein